MLKKVPLFLVFVFCVPCTSLAEDYTWSHAGQGLWTHGTNWFSFGSPGFPGSGDTAFIGDGIVDMDDTDIGSPDYDYSRNIYLYQTNANIHLTGGQLRTWDYQGMEIGTIDQANVTIQHSAGSFGETRYLDLGTDRANPGAAINVNYNMTGGQFSVFSVTLAQGENVTSTLTISEKPPANAPVFHAGEIFVGTNSGTGTINISGGTIHAGSDYDSEYSYSGNGSIVLGADGGTGTMNFSGTAQGYCNYYAIGSYGGTGYAYHSGGTFEADTIFVADYGSNYGELQLSGGTMQARIAAFGFGPSNGYVNQTGGFFSAGYFVDQDEPDGVYGGEFGVGINQIQGSLAVYDLRGGEFRTNNIFYIGGMDAPNPNREGTLAQWNMYGGVMNVYRPWTPDDGEDYSDFHFQNVCIGYVDYIPNEEPLDLNHVTRAELNIFGGEVNIQADVVGYHLNSFLNIYGSKADIYIENIRTHGPEGALDINFMLDSHGVSTLRFETMDLGSNSPLIDANIPGFVSVKVDSMDAVRSPGITLSFVPGNSGWQDNTPFRLVEERFQDGDDVVLRLHMDNNHPTWNLLGTYALFDGSDPYGKISGALKVQGNAVPLQAVFTNLAGQTYGNETLASLLINYLNNALVETGVLFSPFQTNDETSLLLTGDYLNDLGYAWFGWDLSGFNSMYGANVYLYQFNSLIQLNEEIRTPEPATWVLLLLGMGVLARTRMVKVGQFLRN